MSSETVFPYRILLFDDDPDYSKMMKLNLEKHEFCVDVVSRWEDAISNVDSNHYDIVITDLELGGPNSGKEFLEYVRAKNQYQAIVIVTGNETFLDEPIRKYTGILSSGHISFCDKRTDIVKAAKDAASRVDPVRRCLSNMCDAGMGNRVFEIDEQTYKVRELISPGDKTETTLRGLRESLENLMIEMAVQLESDKISALKRRRA